jgi:hypothetical protein
MRNFILEELRNSFEDSFEDIDAALAENQKKFQ